MKPLIIPAAALAPDECCGSIAPDAAADDATVVANDGWFPDIELAHFRAQARVRAEVTVERQREAVVGAMFTVHRDLAAWARARRAAGAARLADVVHEDNFALGGEAAFVILYRRAVYAYAKAELIEKLRDVDTTAAGIRRAEDLDGSVCELRRDGIHAIRDLLGTGRTTVELI